MKAQIAYIMIKEGVYCKNGKNKKDSEKKVIVRFFINLASDFDVEHAVFKIMGDKGLGPKLIEKNENYRVEEYMQKIPVQEY